MKNIKYLILLLFSIVLNNSFAQKDINHLLKEYENASLERKMELFFVFFQKFDVEQKDSVLYYVDDLQREGIEKGNEAAIALSNYGIVPYLQSNSLFEEAKEKLEKAEKYYLRVENDTMLSDLYNCQGNSNYLQGNFSQAEWFYKKSAEFAKSAEEKRFELLSTFNLSKIYTNQGKYELATEMIQEYIDYMLNDNNVERLASAYGIMGQIYLNQEEHA